MCGSGGGGGGGGDVTTGGGAGVSVTAQPWQVKAQSWRSNGFLGPSWVAQAAAKSAGVGMAGSANATWLSMLPLELPADYVPSRRR